MAVTPASSGGGRGWGRSRREFLAAGLALAVPTLHAQSQLSRLPANTTLPAAQALDAEGKPVAIPAAGKPTVVNFWATWCEPCRVEMPMLQQMADFYSDRLVFQAVDFKERAVAVQRHVRNAGWTIPVLFDSTGAAAQAWGVKVFPTTFGFDAQGRLRWKVIGAYDWSSKEAGQLVEGLWR